MKTELTKLETIDDYIAGFPLEVQGLLQKIRLTIKKAAPEAEAPGCTPARPAAQFPFWH